MHDPRDDAREARQDARDGRCDARDRADDPRTVHALSRERERLHDPRRPALARDRDFSPSQQRILTDVAAFRVVRERDLDDTADVRRLADRGLMTVRTSHNGGERYVALTREGARRVRRGQPTREQAVHAEFGRRHVSDRHLRHDAAVYRACRAESARQDPGARLTRISLDVELRAELQRDVALRERELARRLTPQELGPIAARYQVGMTPDGRVHYPDAQLEFEREDRSRFAVGVEITTDDYRSGSVRAKRDAGYSMYHVPSGPGAGVPSRVERSGGAPVRIEEYELWAL